MRNTPWPTPNGLSTLWPRGIPKDGGASPNTLKSRYPANKVGSATQSLMEGHGGGATQQTWCAAWHTKDILNSLFRDSHVFLH